MTVLQRNLRASRPTRQAPLSFLGVGWATLVAAVERSAYAMQLIEAGRLLARSALSEALLIRRLASVFFVTFGVFGASIAGTAGYFAGIGAVEMLSVYFYARVRSPARHTGTPG